MWYSYYAYTDYFETGDYFNGTVSVTRFLGTLSPALRGCYAFGTTNT